MNIDYHIGQALKLNDESGMRLSPQSVMQRAVVHWYHNAPNEHHHVVECSATRTNEVYSAYGYLHSAAVLIDGDNRVRIPTGK